MIVLYKAKALCIYYWCVRVYMFSFSFWMYDQIQALKSGEPAESINLNKETEGSSSNRSENSSEFKLDTSMTRTPRAIENHQLFPASSSLCSASGGGSGGGGGGGIPHQLLHSSSSSSRPYPAVKEETYTNMFGGIDDQSGFWPWLEQQHFNWNSRTDPGSPMPNLDFRGKLCDLLSSFLISRDFCCPECFSMRSLMYKIT